MKSIRSASSHLRGRCTRSAAKSVLFLFVALAAMSAGFADPSVVILVRHAERDPAATDPGLTPEGRRRAERLAATLHDTGITEIFTTSFRRTRETAGPLATALGITPSELTGTDAAADRERLRKMNGGIALVVAHSNTIPALILALGGPSGIQIPDTEFDRLFLLTMNAGGPKLITLRYGH